MEEPYFCTEVQNASDSVEINIYDDICDFDLGEEVERLKSENVSLQQHIRSLEAEIVKLNSTIVDLKNTQDNLASNMSSLYKTAKAEIERKDRMIEELRTQIDNRFIKKFNPDLKDITDREKRPLEANKSKRFKLDEDANKNKRFKLDEKAARSDTRNVESKTDNQDAICTSSDECKSVENTLSVTEIEKNADTNDIHSNVQKSGKDKRDQHKCSGDGRKSRIGRAEKQKNLETERHRDRKDTDRCHDKSSENTNRYKDDSDRSRGREDGRNRNKDNADRYRNLDDSERYSGTNSDRYRYRDDNIRFRGMDDSDNINRYTSQEHDRYRHVDNDRYQDGEYRDRYRDRENVDQWAEMNDNYRHRDGEDIGRFSENINRLRHTDRCRSSEESDTYRSGRHRSRSRSRHDRLYDRFDRNRSRSRSKYSNDRYTDDYRARHFSLRHEDDGYYSRQPLDAYGQKFDERNRLFEDVQFYGRLRDEEVERVEYRDDRYYNCTVRGGVDMDREEYYETIRGNRVEDGIPDDDLLKNDQRRLLERSQTPPLPKLVPGQKTEQLALDPFQPIDGSPDEPRSVTPMPKPEDIEIAPETPLTKPPKKRLKMLVVMEKKIRQNKLSQSVNRDKKIGQQINRNSGDTSLEIKSSEIDRNSVASMSSNKSDRSSSSKGSNSGKQLKSSKQKTVSADNSKTDICVKGKKGLTKAEPKDSTVKPNCAKNIRQATTENNNSNGNYGNAKNDRMIEKTSNTVSEKNIQKSTVLFEKIKPDTLEHLLKDDSKNIAEELPKKNKSMAAVSEVKKQIKEVKGKSVITGTKIFSKQSVDGKSIEPKSTKFQEQFEVLKNNIESDKFIEQNKMCETLVEGKNMDTITVKESNKQDSAGKETSNKAMNESKKQTPCDNDKNKKDECRKLVGSNTKESQDCPILPTEEGLSKVENTDGNKNVTTQENNVTVCKKNQTIIKRKLKQAEVPSGNSKTDNDKKPLEKINKGSVSKIDNKRQAPTKRDTEQNATQKGKSTSSERETKIMEKENKESVKEENTQLTTDIKKNSSEGEIKNVNNDNKNSEEEYQIQSKKPSTGVLTKDITHDERETSNMSEAKKEECEKKQKVNDNIMQLKSESEKHLSVEAVFTKLFSENEKELKQIETDNSIEKDTAKSSQKFDKNLKRKRSNSAEQNAECSTKENKTKKSEFKIEEKPKRCRSIKNNEGAIQTVMNNKVHLSEEDKGSAEENVIEIPSKAIKKSPLAARDVKKSDDVKIVDKVGTEPQKKVKELSNPINEVKRHIRFSDPEDLISILGDGDESTSKTDLQSEKVEETVDLADKAASKSASQGNGNGQTNTLDTKTSFGAESNDLMNRNISKTLIPSKEYQEILVESRSTTSSESLDSILLRTEERKLIEINDVRRSTPRSIKPDVDSDSSISDEPLMIRTPEYSKIINKKFDSLIKRYIQNNNDAENSLNNTRKSDTNEEIKAEQKICSVKRNLSVSLTESEVSTSVSDALEKEKPTDNVSENSISETLCNDFINNSRNTVLMANSCATINISPNSSKNLTKRRITPTRVEDNQPVCSFENILTPSRSNNSQVVKQSPLHLTQEGEIPVLHLDEHHINNLPTELNVNDGNILNLLDTMNISNMDCDMAKFKGINGENVTNTNEKALTFENVIDNASSMVLTQSQDNISAVSSDVSTLNSSEDIMNVQSLATLMPVKRRRRRCRLVIIG